ncbi:ubinuclein-1 isoform X1 [Gastrolobium bilobum]|uniref:ubinuclein-1 isoform X1 n=1 Tax=Gastrolobium bilobum TaxID=150636 RepID=UPI002AAF7C4F|nr:ubinuclein-1 isoform X1 [Gastrolobium bilobum]
MAGEGNAPPGGGDGGDSSLRAPSSFVKKGDRQLFTVELRPGETTIVSWKKLMKDASKVNNGSASAPEHRPNVNPALESRIAPGKPAEIEEQDAPQTNRFSAVIEKIERLYMGKDSSDEEDLLDVPDDQYDTEDSFIDDAELDEYFEVDNSAIKHDGFFVNRGKLERINEPPVLPNQQAKKRRRKDISKNSGEEDGHGSNNHVKVGKTAAGKNALLPGKNMSNSSQNFVVPGEHYEDLKFRNQLDISGISSKKKIADTRPISDPSVCLKVSNDDVPSSVAEAKDADKQKIGVLQSKNTSHKYKDASGLLDTSHQKFHEKNAYAHSKSQLGTPPSKIDELENTGRSKEKNGTRELPDLNLSVGKSALQAPKSENMLKKDGSSVRPKITMLEKAIRELAKMVAESRPPAVENQEADSTSQAVKRRLPREIKLKLAKVARLAQASQGKLSKELISRLMSIVGHLMQLRTLKRNLKIMISSGLSAKQEKDDRFQQTKKEVVEMIKIQAPSMESKQQQQAGASGDQELNPDGKPIAKKNFSMDTALEDKICDLYDLFVDGLDENSGPQIRKLYAQLAELWPNGYMDNHGIKRAICRAKERRRALYSRHKDQEKIKRKKLFAPRPEENVQFNASSINSQQNTRERSASESSSHAFASVNKAVSNTATAARVLNPSVNGPKQEKSKGSSSGSLDDVKAADGVLIKKKVKRKPELELEGTHFRPEKLASMQGEERPRSLKQSVVLSPKSNLQTSSLPGLEQSS